MLFNERMIETYLIARDRFMRRAPSKGVGESVAGDQKRHKQTPAAAAASTSEDGEAVGLMFPGRGRQRYCPPRHPTHHPCPTQPTQLTTQLARQRLPTHPRFCND